MEKVVQFVKKEAVLIISFLLCSGSMLFVEPSKAYFDYIDFKTLCLLFSLMAIMSGLSRIGLFRNLAGHLLSKAGNMRALYLTLVLLCFFSSMVITNDVALITFVPFSLITLSLADAKKYVIYIVTMETIAANLGSMLTPLGNPQNLYLFSAFNMGIGEFFLSIFPYSLLSLILLVLGALPVKKEQISVKNEKAKIEDKRLTAAYALLFVIALAGVFRLVDYRIIFAVILATVLLLDRKSLSGVDYSLLLTFVFLFVFIGNLGNITAVADYLKSIVSANEVAVGIISSQVLSNVPACMLLSGFTKDYKSLLIGVNLGGLGTLIASMASLISFKFIQKENIKSAKYLAVFTALNLIFLTANITLYCLCK